MKSPPAKVLHLLVSRRSRKKILVRVMHGAEKKSVETDENALPAYQKTLDALVAVVLLVKNLPDNYAKNIRIISLIMGMKGETETAEIVYATHSDWSAKVAIDKTPPAMLQTPTQEGRSSPPLPQKLVDLIFEHVDAAKDYFVGKRAQGVLPGIGGEDEDDDAGGGEGAGDEDQLKFPDGGGESPTPGEGQDGPPAEKKKRGPYKKKPKA